MTVTADFRTTLMDPIKQRIAIAEPCGFTFEGPRGRTLGMTSGELRHWRVPDYLNDLNAMHEAEQTLTEAQCQRHFDNLAKATNAELDTLGTVYGVCHFRMYNATAAQRAEAFLRTLNLWTES